MIANEPADFSPLRSYPEREALDDQRSIIADIASGVSVDDVLRRIALFAERHAPDGMAVNIMVYDALTDTLNSSGGQPSIPDSFLAPIKGLKPGPAMGSCGTAAYRREQVITSHIVGHPLWAGFESLMTDHGYWSSWSTPILTADGTLLGTFGMYHPLEHRTPTADEFRLIELFVYLASLAIQRHRSDLALRERAGSDWLTGLYNQNALLERADAALAAEPGSAPAGSSSSTSRAWRKSSTRTVTRSPTKRCGAWRISCASACPPMRRWRARPRERSWCSCRRSSPRR